MSQKQTSKDTLNVISSPESAVGPKLSASPGGQQIALFGQDHVPVSHFPAPANDREKRTNGTFGQSSSGSSESVNLTLSLGSRLKERLEWVGSIEYSQTWKLKVTPAGRQYWAHTASARRISDKDFGGWPTARAQDSYERTSWPFIEKMAAGEVKAQMTLSRAARMAGWRTPSGSDGEGGSMDVLLAQRNGYSPKLKLRDQAPLAMTLGAIPSGSPAPTERRGALNPALSLWLMGYPDEWLSCGVRAMQSSRK